MPPYLIRHKVKVALIAYAILVIASNVTTLITPPTPTSIDPRKQLIQLPATNNAGPIPSQSINLPYLVWHAETDTNLPPAILIHGSPGDANNFAPGPGFGTMSPGLGPTLATDRDIYALDMPGMGDHREPVPTRSTLAHAHAVLAFMRERDIDRAHLVGWSQGGAVVLHAANLDPKRIATITLLAAVGAQETEGSGGYYFEHAKYALGVAASHAAPRLIPHFGSLDASFAQLRTSMHNFWDSDQRPLRGIMESIDTPTLILHGRTDFLVAGWAAERHHELMPTSSLVMTSSGHFMPFTQPALVAKHLAGYMTQHDESGTPATRSTLDLAPTTPNPFGTPGSVVIDFFRTAPWPYVAVVFAIGAFFFPTMTAAIAGLLVAIQNEDLGVALVGLFAGHAIRQRRRHGHLAPAIAVPLLAFLVAPAFASLVSITPTTVRALAWIAAVLVLALVVWLLPNLARKRGRTKLRLKLARARHHEFWPAPIFYLPLIPYLLLLSVRYGGPRAFTRCNPGITKLGGVGGGIVGESKARIQHALGPHPGVLPTTLIKANPDAAARTTETLAAIDTYPVILKPDAGQRGYGVRLARNEQHVREYLEHFPRDFVVQTYHAGPHECGVFWIRDQYTPEGLIFSITRKDFPSVTGDGSSTLAQLVRAHPRYRLQEDVFRSRFEHTWHNVIEIGKTVRLAESGNHAQGTLFRDGEDLRTPELEAELRSITQQFEGFDFGRFDLRYESDESLRKGQRFGIVELNGITSESTNLYDPEFSTIDAYRILFLQWRFAYKIGQQRQRDGTPPVRIAELVRSMLDYYGNRPAATAS